MPRVLRVWKTPAVSAGHGLHGMARGDICLGVFPCGNAWQGIRECLGDLAPASPLMGAVRSCLCQTVCFGCGASHRLDSYGIAQCTTQIVAGLRRAGQVTPRRVTCLVSCSAWCSGAGKFGCELACALYASACIISSTRSRATCCCNGAV